MDILDIINKKREGYTLTQKELKYAFYNYMNGNIPDYQISSLLMAMCIRGMNDKETLDLTALFVESGEILDLSSISSVTVDKHSTGGVGDKTTLIIGPLVAACGIKFPKISGRGLGFTGGTIDKLESIPGFKVNLTKEEFLKQVDKVGFAITSQPANLAPLDKKIYALRDITGTVEYIPLIASSIMSKKIASGAKNIIIDIKVGKGSLIKTKDEALEMGRLVKKIGAAYEKNVETMVSYMDIPLGTSMGNTIEIIEVMKILKGEETNYLVALSKAIAAKMISLAKDVSMNDASKEVDEVLKNGKAYEKFVEMVKAQGGDLTKLKISKNVQRIYSTKEGHITNMDALKFGQLSLKLGGGRKTKEDKIDPAVGIILNKKIGDDVKKGDVLCTLCLSENMTLLDEDITSYYSFDSDGIEEIESIEMV